MTVRCRQETIAISLEREKTPEVFVTACNLTSTFPHFERVGFNVQSRQRPTSMFYLFAVEYQDRNASLSTNIDLIEDVFEDAITWKWSSTAVQLVTPIEGYELIEMRARHLKFVQEETVSSILFSLALD